jgi:hypothetical protein
VGATLDHLGVVHRGELRVDLPAGFAEQSSCLRSRAVPALVIAWPLRSVSPVSEALGVSPVKALNFAAEANRCARPMAATSSGAPTSAMPGRVRASSSGSTRR